MITKIVAISRKQAVVEALRESILSGERPAGSRLNLDEIAEELGVSRMPVREALKQLETEGLVTIYPHRGVEVSELTLDDIEEIFGIRTLLERGAITRAIPNLTLSELEAMREVLTKMDSVSGHGSEWMELNARFHSIINEACGWPRLVEMINILRANVDRYLRTYWRVKGYQKPQQQHWAIYEACRERDVDKAEAILTEHFEDTLKVLLSGLNKKPRKAKPRLSRRGSRIGGEV
jgi:DNA-binding GntR family transcriptional regulator